MPFSAYLQAGLFVLAAAAGLFAAAGTVAIAGFWAYLAIFALAMIVSFAALDPDLLRERMRPGGKKPPLALKIFSLVLFMHWIVAGLDRGRFHWSDNVPGWLQGVCLFIAAAGYALALWAMRVNRFFSSVIRIQTDRGQHVVTTGPYAFVRHPGYTAGILIIAASGPALGSWLAAALVVIFSLPFLLYRAITEDRILQGGTVNQVMGDGIMALFGAPVAHEDHAVRACYAALAMQESVARYAEHVRRESGLDVQIRIGLNSGEVVVRAIGSDLNMDYTAVGQTTHLAARMEQLARSGTTLITADTRHLAEGYVN